MPFLYPQGGASIEENRAPRRYGMGSGGRTEAQVANVKGLVSEQEPVLLRRSFRGVAKESYGLRSSLTDRRIRCFALLCVG